MKHRRITIAVVITLLLLVTSLWIFKPTIFQARAEVDFKSLEIQRTSSGGFTGRGDGKRVVIAGGALVVGDKKTPLAASQANAIVDKINKSRFFDNHNTYTCKNCADQFITTIHIAYKEESNTVTYDEGSDVPVDIQQLDALLLDLLDKD